MCKVDNAFISVTGILDQSHIADQSNRVDPVFTLRGTTSGVQGRQHDFGQ